MPSLASIAVQFFTQERSVREQYTAPVLIWEVASTGSEGAILNTRAGFDVTPQVGDPYVFVVAKRPKKTEAFAMGVTLGHADDNDIVLGDPTVSRFHAYLPLEGKGQAWKIVDAESTHGVWVDGTRLAPGQGHALASHAKIRLGQASLLFLFPEDFFEYLKTAS